MNTLQQIMGSYQRVNRYEVTKKMVEKWRPSGLLEGIEDETKLHNMAILLDNQAKQLLAEASTTSGGTASTEAWSNVALPLIRRTFAKVVAQDLMSVQPMSMPSGLVFWLYFQFGTGKPTNTAIYTSGESIHGDVSSSATIDGNLYNWDYSYTRNYISASTVTATMTTASFADINYDYTLSASYAAAPENFHKVQIAQSALTGVEPEAVDAIRLTDAGSVVYQWPKYATKDATNLYFIMSGSDSASVATVEYLKKTSQDARGDFESGQTGVGAIPQINIQMKNSPIVADTRKLKASWTPEIAQDLAAYHSVDAEAELTNILSEYMAMEIDMELLQMLLNNARVTNWWSAKAGADLDSTTGAYVSGAPTFYGTRMEWYQTLIQKITKVSNDIHKRTLRGGANWIVVGTTVATILESMKPAFIADGSGVESTEYAMGLTRVGTLDGRWKVYKNPYFRDDMILMGYRGGSFLETGAVYAPYIPIITTPLVYNYTDFTPHKGIMTRYAKKLVRPEFYGVIKLRDMHLI